MKASFLVAATAVLSGCASLPNGPSVMVLPGSTKTWDQFQIDNADCRNYSGSVVGGKNASQAAGDSSTNQQRYDLAFTQCMYAKGHQVPIARGSYPRPRYSSAAPPPPTSSATPPPPPAGTPPPPPAGYRVN